jgi:hypothetical protein
MIWFDTRDGLATIQGRVYNNSEGRPATIEELDAVGKYLLNTHLNVSNEPITPESWLNFCESLDRDMILDPSIPDGVYIAPIGYEINENGKLVPMNTSEPITETKNETENPAPAARKERAAK